MSLSSKSTTPLSGESNPAMIRNNVVLPHPEGPRREKNSPFLMSILTSSRALKAPYALDTFSTFTSYPFKSFPLPPHTQLFFTDAYSS